MMEPKWFGVLLALLFIQGWTETEGCLEQERVALLQLKHFFNSFHFLHNWMGSQCCQWEGVMCSNTGRRVIQLSLISTRGQEDGYLNASLFLPFKELKNLYLMGNGIAGFVVNQGIANLSSALQKLELLDLSFNHLNDSSILSWLSDLSSLKSLNLSGNGFTGSNHSNGFKWLSRLSKLETLDLSSNHLKNNILLHVAALSSLKTLNLARNELEGSFTIKGSRRQVLMNLEELDLSVNLLQNSSFEFISRLSNLKSLSIQGNNLQGSIDIKELNKLTKLQKLDLSYNHIESLESFDDTERQLKLIYLEQLDLRYNLLNNSRLGVIISELSNLRSLSLRSIKPKGSINIKELGRLRKLKSLYLDGVFSDGTVSLLQVVQSFPSVKTFSLSDNYLNKTIYPQELNNISSSVHEIFLYESHLSNNILHSIGALTSLKRLILSDSGLIGPLPTKGWCDLWNLEELDLSRNALEGSIPSCFSNLTSLRSLDISQNRIEISSLFDAFVNNSLLNYLFVDQNRLVTEPTFQAQSQTKNTKFQLKMLSMSNCITKGFPQELRNFLYYQYDLRYLDLSYNNFAGQNPSWLLDNNTRLQQFLMTGNSFKGSLQLPKHSNVDMFEVDMSGNKMQGQIPMNICSTFPHLKGFSLSKNAFQGNIPPCLGGMKSLSLLDLSYNNFSGGKFEEFAKSSSLLTLRLSSNNLSGKIPPSIFSSTTLNQLYLDGNNFDGEIPPIGISTNSYPVLSDLDLSNNHLSGKLPRWMWNVSNLQKLVLSNNHFTGLIPLELCNSASLAFLDLSQNNFSGSIPSCFSSLTIEHLYLSRNRLSGPLPHALYNSSSLVTLDLSQNNFTGKIPIWIGTLPTLSALLLKANQFEGEIPSQICRLNSLSIIDLSQNKLSGPVPSCLSILSLQPTNDKSFTVSYAFLNPVLESVGFGYKLGRHSYPGSFVEEQVVFTTKKGLYTYSGIILDYMSGIDLSCNRLTGQIPPEMGNLSELHSLNLSYNSLTGSIPSTFSMLSQIESLDLSHNKLSGILPVQLMELNSLAVFNVSYNNLSGSIPHEKAQFATFDESSYLGNPLLCGPPKHESCTETGSTPTSPNASDNEEENGLLDMHVFYISFVVCYTIVVMTMGVVLYINPYWRRVWFYFIQHCINTCHYFILDNVIGLSIFRTRL